MFIQLLEGRVDLIDEWDLWEITYSLFRSALASLGENRRSPEENIFFLEKTFEFWGIALELGVLKDEGITLDCNKGDSPVYAIICFRLVTIGESTLMLRDLFFDIFFSGVSFYESASTWGLLLDLT